MTKSELLDKLDNDLKQVVGIRDTHYQIQQIINGFRQLVAQEESKKEEGDGTTGQR